MDHAAEVREARTADEETGETESGYNQITGSGVILGTAGPDSITTVDDQPPHVNIGFRIEAGGGADIIDTTVGGRDVNEIYTHYGLSEGSDTMVGGTDADTVYLGARDHTIWAGMGDHIEVVGELAGWNTVNLYGDVSALDASDWQGISVIRQHAESRTAVDLRGPDSGNAGNDGTGVHLSAHVAGSAVHGGAGGDDITIRSGVDAFGGGGDDRINMGDGFLSGVTVDGGTGYDTLFLAYPSTQPRVTELAENVRLTNIEEISGGGGNGFIAFAENFVADHQGESEVMLNLGGTNWGGDDSFMELKFDSRLGQAAEFDEATNSLRLTDTDSTIWLNFDTSGGATAFSLTDMASQEAQTFWIA
ncbi:hypothetical protein [Telmatospirillum sp. J64-1]|uniref:hypothetical protein n=1 Tax=Telmatospirillum sp. J64-1 TaxID=2502183 RepID=UPI00115D39DF|nr:hypothetical protein [Telmatospirillum sp. J64-1]